MAERRGDIELRYNATALDYILLLPLFGKMFLAVIARLLIRPFSKRPKPRTLLKDVVFTILRTFLGGVNVAQDTLFSISTADGYASFVKKNKLPATETVLGSGLKAFWFGPKSADKIVLFFHGGGYAKAASPGHFAWLHDLQKDLAAKGHSVSVFLPAYEVTTDRPSPKGRYPIQLQQAAESLAWLIEKEHKKPSDIIVAGDSAGGHMTISLLSHLLHPHPAATKITLAEPLASAILISPWNKLFPSPSSMDTYKQTSDMIIPSAGQRWSSMYLGLQEEDSYNNPHIAPPEWFGGLEGQVRDVLVWGGGGEAIITTIVNFSEKLKTAHPKVELVVQPGAAHDDPIIEKLLGYKEKHEGTRVIEAWIGERL